MSFFERYWPTLLAVPVMAGVGLWFWSNRSSEQVSVELPPTSDQEAELAADLEADLAAEEELPTSLGRPGGAQVLEVTEPAAPGVQYRESLEYVPEVPGEPAQEYNQDSPEVKQALAQVKIELYGTQSCVHCEAARSFMTANHLSFADYNTETDDNLKEKALRLSGSAGVPVIVVDGQVLQGFSQSAFQAKLTSAVRARVLR